MGTCQHRRVPYGGTARLIPAAPFFSFFRRSRPVELSSLKSGRHSSPAARKYTQLRVRTAWRPPGEELEGPTWWHVAERLPDGDSATATSCSGRVVQARQQRRTCPLGARRCSQCRLGGRGPNIPRRRNPDVMDARARKTVARARSREHWTWSDRAGSQMPIAWLAGGAESAGGDAKFCDDDVCG
ncbi:hypothetical protein PHLGIDRAFT_349883 [Phlebiopsis gigantea 11061_1 CR5-6]|uniref:Uncharacterized protein n=1 Tax=Phlebiopsis gigantea (strain 11061_1 CR5-6) TaxID=745531 RepID=A0A0C3RPN5_PHLG1|nr:hypothetical protein PHLGIDRAFT_349883 [Phlebiopsis gigantea 11061_1 CR5-6]